MTFAAFTDLHNDDAIVAYPTALRVYAMLLRNPLIFYKPQEIKVWWLADHLKTHRDRVTKALNLLTERGYVIDHGRDLNNVRKLTVALERQPMMDAS